MRRVQALLIAAGLAAAPASAVAGPFHDSCSPPQTFESFAVSPGKGRLGVTVMSLTPELRKHFGAAEDRGVLVAHVEPGTPAAEAGITVGDVIVEVRGKAVDSASDVRSALADASKGQSATIQLVHDGKPRSLQATLADDPPPNPFDPKWSGMPWLQELLSPLAPQNQRTPRENDWFHQLHELLDPGQPYETNLRS